MNSVRLAYSVIVLAVCGLVVAALTQASSSHVVMSLVDTFEQTSPEGIRTIFAVVETSEKDSLLIRDYASLMFHNRVSNSLSATAPVQMITYYYQPDNLKPLHPMRVLQMSGGDKKRFSLLKNLASDTAGFVSIRLSNLFRSIQSDSLFVQRGEVVVPVNGTQLKDFFTQPLSR